MVQVPLFLVEVQIHDLPAIPVRALLGKQEVYILLGRDVLNAHRILLDGPHLVTEIEQPPTT